MILRHRNPSVVHALSVAKEKHIVDPSIWRRIKDEMVKHGIENANQLSLKCGGEPSTASMTRWESGQDMPSRRSVVKIAGVLGVSASRFLDPQSDDPNERTIFDALSDPDAREAMANAARQVANIKSKLRGEMVEPPEREDHDAGPKREI